MQVFTLPLYISVPNRALQNPECKTPAGTLASLFLLIVDVRVVGNDLFPKSLGWEIARFTVIVQSGF
jgi:hypothetical protein